MVSGEWGMENNENNERESESWLGEVGKVVSSEQTDRSSEYSKGSSVRGNINIGGGGGLPAAGFPAAPLRHRRTMGIGIGMHERQTDVIEEDLVQKEAINNQRRSLHEERREIVDNKWAGGSSPPTMLTKLQMRKKRNALRSATQTKN